MRLKLSILLGTAALALIACEAEQVVDLPQPPAAEKPVPQIGGAENIMMTADGQVINLGRDGMCRRDVIDGNIAAALKTGDASLVEDEKALLDDMLQTLECARTQFNSARAAIFNLDADGSATADSLTAISWNPTHDAAILGAMSGESEALLVTNAVSVSSYDVREEALAVIGTTGKSRHIAMGSNPMRTKYRGYSDDPQMDQFMKNSVAWLAGRDDFTAQPLRVTIAQMTQGYYFPDEVATRSWLTENYADQVSFNAAGECDDAALIDCLPQTDLLIISNAQTGEDIEPAKAAVQAAITQGIPVLYMHYDGGQTDMSRAILPLLKTRYVGDNVWRRLALSNYDAAPEFGQLSESDLSVRALLGRFKSGDFRIDFSGCENHSCPEESGYQAKFSTTTSEISARINLLDKAGQNLFETEGRRLDKGLVLLADKYRQAASYPMDKMTTPTADFLKSLYADSVVHTARKINPVQSDMGNFSRSDFSHITPVSKTVEMTSRDTYKAAGVYALPGQTVRVTRHDSAAVSTHIKVNLIRSGATHLFDENRYNRPKYLSSQDLPIRSGETIEFTSPYGGPLQIRFDAKDQDVSFTFENVGEHAVWRGPEDNESFSQKLNAGDFDWAELITPSFQVHSTLEKMRQTVESPVWGSAAAVGEATETYLHNYPHVLAGFQGVGIDVVPEIHDFAAANGLEIHTLDKVKHMNADQASCGYGCSGNPYDAYWAFNPIGHGDIHELGHGLERGRFRYTGQPGHTGTNPYSYYAKAKFYRATGDADNLGCQSLPYEDMFSTLQASRNAADPSQYMRDQNLTAWNQGAAINFQIMMAAQNLGILEDGTHLLARQHIVDREFNIADNNDAAWAEKKDGLGFGSFTRAEARALSNNDWNLIALSHALQRDISAYLEMWGFELTDGAKAHVAAWNYPALPLEYYAASSQAHCTGFPTETLPIDGKASWPTVSQKPLGKQTQEAPMAAGHVCTHEGEAAHEDAQ